jgi:hypothetical protein
MYTFFISLLGSFMAPKVMIALGGVLGLILANLVLGVLLSAKTRTFDIRKLPQFLETNFMPYIGGLLVLALFSNMDPTLSVLFFTISAAVYAKFLANIKDQLVQLFGEVPVVVPATPAVGDTGVITPKPITEVIQETIDQVGEQAKTQAVHDLTQQFAEVVQKAVLPVDVIPVA